MLRILGLTMVLFLGSCGHDEPPTAPKGNLPNSADSQSGVSHKVFLNVGSNDGLALRQALVDTLTYDIVCDQYSQLGLSGGVAEIFDGSTNCLVKLNSFSLENGRLYMPRTGAEFATYLPGEVAIFDSADLTLYVMVETQLPVEIKGPSDLKYKFSELNNFKDLAAQKKVEHGILTMLSGDFAVGIKISSPVYDNDSIEFTGECMNEAVVGTVIADGSCLGDALANIKLALAPYPANTDRATLSAISNSASNLAQLNADFMPQDPGITNGGFKASLPFNPGDLQDRILVLNVEGSSSYLFGRIKFTE